MPGVIRIAVLDDHPAVLAGLHRLAEHAPDLLPVAFVQTQEDLLRALDACAADVVIVDYDLARGDGLAVCQRLKARTRPLGVVVYSAYAGPALAVAARVAGADALVDKSRPVSELMEAVRHVAGGGTALPQVDAEVRQAAMARLEQDDVAVAAMLIAGTSHQGIAEILGLERREVAVRVRRIVARVRPNGPRHEYRAHGAGPVAPSPSPSPSTSAASPA
jgi:two-component system, NarL family, response regulator DevR